MSLAIITGAGGLVGSEACRHFADLGMDIIGIDNNMRRRFFGKEASTRWQVQSLKRALAQQYRHCSMDIRDEKKLNRLFRRFGNEIQLIIHTAAQPSHDWAAQSPKTDFSINAVGTLNLLEATRQYAPQATFIFTSTNKVYGDAPNRAPLVELDTRWEIPDNHPWINGIPEDLSIDQSMHSLFGASKLSADVMVQEYGRYFGLATGTFRGGCLTGPNHSGTQLHGFLAYLMKCTVTGSPYTVFGYRGKQVRDNIHSSDLVRAFEAFYRSPRPGEVYNIGGGRFSNCSMLEAIQTCENISGQKLSWSYSETNRSGDHIWWISDISRFRSHYPDWNLTYDVPRICQELFEANVERWTEACQS